jgi:hypothetical protein
MGRSGQSELKDAGGLLGDGEALRARIAEDGYVFVRGLLDPDMIAAVGRVGLAQLQRAGWTESGPDPVAAAPRAPVRAVRVLEAMPDPGYRRVMSDPGFNRIGFAPPLTDLMGEILGPTGFCYPLRLPRIVYPHRWVPHQPGNTVHKDYRAVQDMFTCWVPLEAVPPSLGGLALQTGSHHTTRVRHRPLDRLEGGWRTADYQPGDVLVFHCLTTHAALPNGQDRMRLSGEFRWQRHDQPAPQRVVIGPRGHEIGSRLFSGTPWWRSVLPGLVLFDDTGPGPRSWLPAPPSRFVDFGN